MPNFLIYLSATLIILTKLADVLTTLRFLRSGSIAMEHNSFVRKLMLGMGANLTVWLVFLLTIVIVAIVLLAVLQSGIWWYEWSFVVISVFVSVVQANVAYYNYSGKANRIVRLVGGLKPYK